mmetsp:Transcript_15041/g.57063  ORF Transcript_15041/g.57063 Transcript_15041/m.57063 type:complete len:141 (-) Transcript_15041:338-760(-)
MAASTLNAAVVTSLIDRGAWLEITDGEGQTPLAIAALFGISGREVVSALVSGGAKIDVPYKLGWLPLHTAALLGDKELCILHGTPEAYAKIWEGRNKEIRRVMPRRYRLPTDLLDRKKHPELDELLRRQYREFYARYEDS